MSHRHAFKLDIYPDCCCDDCAEYGKETDGQCEIFNEAVASLPQGFGEMEIPRTTSKCSQFKPGADLLADLADEAAYRREQDARERARGAA